MKVLFMCHRKPERSLFYKGKQFPVCARCTGMYIGYIIGLIMILAGVNIGYIALALTVPLAVDGSMQLILGLESNNTKRIITGLMFGIGIMLCIQDLLKLVGSWGRGLYYYIF